MIITNWEDRIYSTFQVDHKLAIRSITWQLMRATWINYDARIEIEANNLIVCTWIMINIGLKWRERVKLPLAAHCLFPSRGEGDGDDDDDDDGNGEYLVAYMTEWVRFRFQGRNLFVENVVQGKMQTRKETLRVLYYLTLYLDRKIQQIAFSCFTALWNGIHGTFHLERNLLVF